MMTIKPKSSSHQLLLCCSPSSLVKLIKITVKISPEVISRPPETILDVSPAKLQISLNK